MFEEQRLDIMSASPEFKAALPLGPPSRPARTQALHLATNGDVLIGQADNGVMSGSSVALESLDACTAANTLVVSAHDAGLILTLQCYFFQGLACAHLYAAICACWDSLLD